MTTSWAAPAVERPDPDLIADERTSLEQWLDFHRATLLMKCTGLSVAQLKQAAVPPSNLTLLGLVRHMAEVERWWFRSNSAAEPVDQLYCSDASPDGDFDDVAGADAQADLDVFRAEIDACRAAVAARPLDEVVKSPRGRRDRDLRWIYVHMIEEYARHNGHADLIRECVDGVTGD
jgi:hypothetical protein